MMKRIGGIIVFFVLLFIFAKWGPTIHFNSTTQTKGEPFVVSGEGKVSVTPDIAKIDLGIQDSGASLKTVQDSINKKSKTLVDALKKLGIAEADIKTTSYNVYPQYDYTNPNSRITGYQASTNYEVTIKDFDKINNVIAVSTGAGANMVGGVNFELNEVTKKQKLQEARSLAVKEAKDKAEGLAKAAGINLGKIINISENNGVPFPRPLSLPVSGGGGAEDKSIAQPNIQPGETEIDVTISLSYEIR